MIFFDIISAAGSLFTICYVAHRMGFWKWLDGKMAKSIHSPENNS
jgi:hypothetical protein